MSRKALALGAPLALGGLVLAWALGSAREEPAPTKKKTARARTSDVLPMAVPEEVGFTAPSPTTPAAAASTADLAIRARIRELERRLADLEARRDLLEVENGDLEKEIAAKQVHAAALAMAQARVRSWEKLLNLNETQKREILDLATNWAKEDHDGRASRETWGSREADLRARLSSEQAARLGESVITMAAQQWRFMGQTIGAYAGLPGGEHARLQQVVGDFRAPSNPLLQEAHGLDWAGLLREAAARARPLLTTEQVARVEKHMGNN